MIQEGFVEVLVYLVFIYCINNAMYFGPEFPDNREGPPYMKKCTGFCASRIIFIKHRILLSPMQVPGGPQAVWAASRLGWCWEIYRRRWSNPGADVQRRCHFVGSHGAKSIPPLWTKWLLYKSFLFILPCDCRSYSLISSVFSVGGSPGDAGLNLLHRRDGRTINLGGKTSVSLEPGVGWEIACLFFTYCSWTSDSSCVRDLSTFPMTVMGHWLQGSAHTSEGGDKDGWGGLASDF